MSPKAPQPQKLVLDASVVLKSYLPEEGSAQAQAIFKDRALGHEGLPLITGDKRLYNAVKAKLRRVRWVEDYQPLSLSGTPK